MPIPTCHTGTIALAWLRRDLPRQQALEYWRGPHGRIVGRTLGFREYRQHVFSQEDHGFWPALQDVETATPADRRPDGIAEVTFAGVWLMALGILLHGWRILLDEANVFGRTVMYGSRIGGVQWLRAGEGESAVARTVIMLRRKPGVSGAAFRAFVNQCLSPALDRAPGVLELRVQTFLPWLPYVWPAPGLAHDNPSTHHHHAVIVVGAADRAALDAVLRSAPVMATAAMQGAHCSAIHAYAVANTYVRCQDGRPHP
jgi:hypothetical protein